MRWGGGETNLAKLDYAGNKLNSVNTANCYIIRKKGTYQIPLVYGNAIKDDQTNVESFYTEGIATNFEDSYGVLFTASSSPYIKDHASAKGKSIASAELLWNDGTSTITNLSVDENFLTFDVGTFSPSNALIAVKDNNGTILWSWHLWLTNEDLTPKIITNADGIDFKVMPCNLGWNGWTADGNPTSPYYQWGRKDPFIANGNPTEGGPISYNTTETISQYMAHNNPTIFYNAAPMSDWCSSSYSYFWDSMMKSSMSIGKNQTVTKTIYDPCPAGWNIPQLNTFTGFSINNATYDDTAKGLKFKDKTNTTEIMFPLAGYRDVSAILSDVKNRGICWLATPSGMMGSEHLKYDSGYLNAQMNDAARASGYSVRPVFQE